MRIVIIATVVTLCVGVKLPPDFEKCDRKLPDLNQCLLRAAQQGVAKLTRAYSEVNLPNLEPFLLAETKINGGNGPVAVNQTFKNCKLHGFSKIVLQKFELDLEKKTLDLIGTFPEIKMECEYEMKGQVLIIPVNGKGNSVIVLKNLKITSHMEHEERKKRNKTYLQFVSSEMTMDPELVTFNFQNSRDRTITDTLNPVLNDNWKEIFDDVKGGYTDIINKILVEVVNNFFTRVSVEEALD